jgi:hypothetical protein
VHVGAEGHLWVFLFDQREYRALTDRKKLVFVRARDGATRTFTVDGSRALPGATRVRGHVLGLVVDHLLR